MFFTDLSKKGQIKGKFMSNVITAIVFLVILFAGYAAIIPEIQSAGNSLNESNMCVSIGCVYNVSPIGPNTACLEITQEFPCERENIIPLANLFGTTGIALLVIMAGLILLIFKRYSIKK